ncbi:MAG: acyltransferase, partial [Calditrichales bacterium]|nr:acyltransferase [Calditrichales bacterium]
MLGIKIDYDKRIYGYDLLRAFAIFCVIHGHGSHLLGGTVLENFPWFKLPHGVDVFFVISGFLIGYSFIVNINKTNGKLALSKSLNFWKRSALRILPNYYLILAINYILVNSDISAGSTDKFGIVLFATFTQNLYYPFYDFFWESWSLAVQEWFYLLFPIFLMIFTRLFNIKSAIL